jgi:hypothetical protein
MAAVTVKDLPDVVYSDLKQGARSEGRSLNSYIVAILKTFADERNRRKLMRDNRAQFRAFLETLPGMGDSSGLIREDRDHAH